MVRDFAGVDRRVKPVVGFATKEACMLIVVIMMCMLKSKHAASARLIFTQYVVLARFRELRVASFQDKGSA